MTRLWAGLLIAFTHAAAASPWEYSAPIAVTSAVGKGIFHHLDSASRKHIAVSDGTVAVAWEDNRTGKPQVYWAYKARGAQAFARDQQLSGGKEAYEPVIVALAKGRFLAAWEEDGRIVARIVQPDKPGPPLVLADNAAQVNLAAGKNDTGAAVWIHREGRATHVRQASWEAAEKLHIQTARTVNASPPTAERLYPSVAVTAGGVVVVWEDRRDGHTVLYFSHAHAGQGFSAPQRLNEKLPSRSDVFGRGTGVARVALSTHGDNKVAAAWLDKRDFEGGYDVYAAISEDGGRHFGKNQKVQDQFGDVFGQWHAAIAGHASGQLAVAWDDDRDETADVWLAWPQANGWSDNLAVPGASGAGEQHHPSIALDRDNGLHLVWLERDTLTSPTRLRYLYGRFRGK